LGKAGYFVPKKGILIHPSSTIIRAFDNAHVNIRYLSVGTLLVNKQ